MTANQFTANDIASRIWWWLRRATFTYPPSFAAALKPPFPSPLANTFVRTYITYNPTAHTTTFTVPSHSLFPSSETRVASSMEK